MGICVWWFNGKGVFGTCVSWRDAKAKVTSIILYLERRSFGSFVHLSHYSGGASYRSWCVFVEGSPELTPKVNLRQGTYCPYHVNNCKHTHILTFFSTVAAIFPSNRNPNSVAVVYWNWGRSRPKLIFTLCPDRRYMSV